MFAAAEGHWEEVRLVLEARASPVLKDSTGLTAADLASVRGHCDLAKWLEGLAASFKAARIAELARELGSTSAAARAFEASVVPPEWQPPPGWLEVDPEIDVDVDHDDTPREARGSCKLVLQILSASCLSRAFLHGSTDPVVRVRSDGKFIGTTSMVRNSTEPQWNETFELAVFGREELILSVWDVDVSGVTDDDLLGRIIIQLRDYDARLRAGGSVHIVRDLLNQPIGETGATLTVELQYDPASLFL